MVATAKEFWNLLTFFLRKVKFPWPIELEKNSQISPGNGLQPPLTALEMKETMKIKENEVHDFRVKPTRACITAESSNCTKEHTKTKL